MDITKIKDDLEYEILFDKVLLRPACDMMHTYMGLYSEIANLFNKKTWLYRNTHNLEVLRLSGTDLRALVAIVNGLCNRPGSIYEFNPLWFEKYFESKKESVTISKVEESFKTLELVYT